MENKVAARATASRWYARFPRALPLGAFLIAALLTALSVIAIERVETQRAASETKRVAVAIAAAIERRASANSAYLVAGAALMGERDVTTEEFRRFAGELARDSNFRGSEGMGWARMVDAEQEPAYLAEMRRQRGEGFRIYPAGGATGRVRTPVTWIEPDTPRNRVAFGFDMYSEPVRRAGMDAAARNGYPTATRKMVLVQDQGTTNRPGFIIYMPVIDQQDAGRLAGFIYSPFTAQHFLDSVLDAEQRATYGVRLYDGEARADNLLAALGPQTVRDTWQIEPLTIAGRPMSLAVDAPEQPWLSTLSVLTLAFGLIAAALMLVLIRLVTRQATEDRSALAWFEEQAAIRNTLTRELNHRVKNTLANVLSIISLTKRRAKGIEEFAEALTGRVTALSATHDLLTQSEWGATPIRSVVDAELAPYIGGAEGTVTTRGPEVEIAPNDALSLGLALHELATNASQYGALGVPEGKVEVRWELVTSDLARISWTESDGPPVPGERTRGFGTELIEKIVAHELGTAVDLRFEPAGVQCTMLVPVRRPSPFRIRAGRN